MNNEAILRGFQKRAEEVKKKENMHHGGKAYPEWKPGKSNKKRDKETMDQLIAGISGKSRKWGLQASPASIDGYKY